MKTVISLFAAMLGAYSQTATFPVPQGHYSACFVKIQAVKQGHLGSFNAVLRANDFCRTEAELAKNLSAANKNGNGDPGKNPFLFEMQQARDTCGAWLRQKHIVPSFCDPVIRFVPEKLILAPEKDKQKAK